MMVSPTQQMVQSALVRWVFILLLCFSRAKYAKVRVILCVLSRTVLEEESSVADFVCSRFFFL